MENMENREWENIKKIENMESLKNVKLEIWKMWKKIIEIRGEASWGGGLLEKPKRVYNGINRTNNVQF